MMFKQLRSNVGVIIERIIVINLSVMCALLPLIKIYGLIDPTQTSKFIVFSFAIPFLLIFSLLLIGYSRFRTFKITYLDGVLFILFCYITINRLLLANGNFSIAYIELLGLGALYVILRQLSFISYVFLFLAIIIGGTIQVIQGQLQLYGYFPSNHSLFNITGGFFNPGPYAGYLASIFPIALGWILLKFDIEVFRFFLIKKIPSKHSKSLKFLLKLIPIVGLCLITLIIGATQSRAAWISIAVSSLYLFLNVYKVKGLSTVLKYSIIVIIISGSLIGLYFLRKGSADGRLLIWKVSCKIIGDNPWFGTGYDTFKSGYMDKQAIHNFNSSTQETVYAGDIIYAFNDPLQFITENGIIGGVLLLMLFPFLFYKKNRRLIIVRAGLISIVVFSFFSYPSQILPIKINLVVYLSVISNFNLTIFSFTSFEDVKSRFLMAALPFLGLVSLLFIVKKTNDSLNYFKTWNNGYSSYEMKDYDEALQYYLEIYPNSLNDGAFLTNYGKLLSVIGRDHEAIKILKLAECYQNSTVVQIALGDSYKNIKQYKNAEKAYFNAHYMIPSRLYPHYLLARMYEQVGQRQKAVSMAKYLLSKEVKVPSIAVQEIKLEMRKILKTNEIK